MKTPLLLFLVLSLRMSPIFSQGTWTWKNGSIGDLGITESGVGNFAPNNNPSSRYAAVCWTDNNGDFWRYGGGGFGDMWKYDVTLGQWALMHGNTNLFTPAVNGTQGVANINNTPGEDTFGHPNWVDSQNNLWMYSINGNSELWMYNTSSNMWTWVKGNQNSWAVYGTQGVPSANVTPGLCNETDMHWIDSNDNLWLFNELDGVLWKYDPTINQWTWIKGTPNGAPVYGTIGVSSPNNQPGAFSGCPSVGTLYCTWQDSNNDFWMIVNRDGATLDAEIWKYSITLNEWTCMRIDQSNFGDPQTNYGTQCTESSTAFPIPRTELRARWVDNCDNLWIYGGVGFCNQGTQMNDLWRYSPVTNNWTWIKGTSGGTSFGVQNVPSVTNQPPNGMGQSHWQNTKGFWLQGGDNFDLEETHQLWLYVADTVIADYTYAEGNSCLDYNFTDNSTTGCNYISSYLWNFDDPNSGNSNTSNIANPSHTFSAPGTYNVSLIVSNCTWDSDTVYYSITTNCGFQLFMNDTTICQGECIDLIVNSTENPDNLVFNWDNNILSTNDTVTICPNTTTTYNVTSTNANGDVASSSSVVTVVPYPVVNLGNDTTICSVPLTLNANNNNLNYLWQDGSTNQTYNVTTSGIYYVTVSNGGCSSSDTININVNAPLLNLGNDTTSCTPNFILDAQNAGATYTWQDGSTNQFYSVNDTGTYYVTVVDNNGCSVSDTLIVAPGNIAFTLGNDTIVCNDATLSLSIPVNNATYQWSNSSTTQSINVNQNGLYIGTATVGVCQHSDSINVNFEHPIAVFSVSDTIDCAPISVNFTDLTNTLSPITNWLWDFGDGQTSTVQNPTHAYEQSGIYVINLEVTTQTGCVSDTNKSVTIQIYDNPVADFTFTPVNPQQNEEVVFQNLSQNSTSWLWTFGDGQQSTVEHPIHFYTNLGTYSVTLLANNHDCIDSTSKTITLYEELIFYVPNSFTPDGDAHNNTFKPIFTSGFDIYDYHLIIYNRWGEIIFESYNSEYGWNGTYANGGIVQDGVYIWQIKFGDINNDKKYIETGHVTLIK